MKTAQLGNSSFAIREGVYPFCTITRLYKLARLGLSRKQALNSYLNDLKM